MGQDANEHTIDSKKKLVDMLQKGEKVQPIVIYDLIRNDVLSWDEFMNLFNLYYRGDYRDHMISTYELFWNMMHKRIKEPSDGAIDEQK